MRPVKTTEPMPVRGFRACRRPLRGVADTNLRVWRASVRDARNRPNCRQFGLRCICKWLTVKRSRLCCAHGLLASLESSTIKASVFVTAFSFAIYLLARVAGSVRQMARS